MLRRVIKVGAGVFSKTIIRTDCVPFEAIVSTNIIFQSTPPIDFKKWFSADVEKKTFEVEADIKRHEAANLLRSLNAHTFREYLRNLSDHKMHVQYKELVTLAVKQGAAATPEEAHTLIDTLVYSGFLFRYRDVIYLSADDLAEILLTSLPDTEAEFKARIEQLESEVRPLENEKHEMEENASKISTYILWGGLCIMIVQFAVFFRLTFWELSWDFMEPVSYFVSLGYGILFYLYFLLVNENPEFEQIRDRLRVYFKRKKEQKFDYQRYERLQKELARYRKYLARSRL